MAGLAWYTYDLGCLPDPLDELTNMIGEAFLGTAKAVVAVDIALHNWASGTGWISALSPLVTAATRDVHQALFTPWAGLSLALLALTLLIRAHRGELASAVTMTAWALAVLALVAGVTAYPLWAANQVSSLMASTINSMDAGFVGQNGEAAAAGGHASLVVSAVLYRQWLTGEFGSATSAAARHWGPELLQAQALTWQQAAGTSAQVAAAQQAKENTWSSIAGQVKASDPILYQMLQGKGGSRIGVGMLTLANAIIVCGFDDIASLVIIVAMLFTLVVVIFLPALAVVGLHHGLRQAVTGALSRAAGLLLSAVLYAAAAGVNLRASAFLLSKEDALAGPGVLAGFGPTEFGVMVLQLALGITLFLAVRKIKTGRAIPRAVAYGGLVAADLALRRSAVAAGAAAGGAAGAAAAGPAEPIWVDSDATVIRPRPALPPGQPGGGGGPESSAPPPDWPRPPDWPQPPDGPSNTGGGYYMGGPQYGEWPPGSMRATKGPDGTWQIYRGSPDLGDDPGSGP